MLTGTAAAALFLSLEPPTRPVRVYAAQRKPVASLRGASGLACVDAHDPAPGRRGRKPHHPLVGVIADQSSSSSFVDDDRRNLYEDEGQQRRR